MLLFQRGRTLPFLSKHILKLNPPSRSYHNAIAKFTKLDAKGMPVSYDIGILVGEPEDSYVYVEPKVGNAIKSAIVQQLWPDMTIEPETLALRFHHASQHFAHKSVPLPRIDIFRSLGQSNGDDVSPATLWLSGNSHAITLDGSLDDMEIFKRLSRESSHKVKGAF